jgi:hypothetical protein
MSEENWNDDDADFKEFEKSMKRREKFNKKVGEIGFKSRADGSSDVAEAMHIMGDHINRSSRLNVGAMLSVSSTFESVFRAFMEAVDPGLEDGDPVSKFIKSCGIVDDGECSCCSKAGDIELHDLQLVAGIAAIRFFLFARLRKIGSALPIIEEVLKDGQPEKALAMLGESMDSVGMMMENMHKLGLGLRKDHPLVEKVDEGITKSKEMVERIKAAIAAKNGK